MATGKTESFQLFEQFIAGTGGTYVFDGASSVHGIGVLLDVIKDMGLDPGKREEFKTGMFSLFHTDTVNMPDLASSRFLLAPNHVSDVDALLLGLLHPAIRIVSKDDWTNNEKLRRFLDLHYDVCGLERTSLQSLRRLLSEAVGYFNHSSGPRHYLVFSQGTISDFNNNSPERISPIIQKIADRTEVPVVCVFLEQASLYHPTRIVFDDPVKLSGKEDFRQFWLEQEAVLQESLNPPARRPSLSQKHANNNKPGDPFF